MKKTYQHPTTDVVLVSLSQMIAASQEGGLLKEEDGKLNDLDLNDIADTEATSGNLSRRSVWDDEEEEQY